MVTETDERRLRYSRARRAGAEANPESSYARRRGHWTGYQPLDEAITRARLEALKDGALKSEPRS